MLMLNRAHESVAKYLSASVAAASARAAAAPATPLASFAPIAAPIAAAAAAAAATFPGPSHHRQAHASTEFPFWPRQEDFLEATAPHALGSAAASVTRALDFLVALAAADGDDDDRGGKCKQGAAGEDAGDDVSANSGGTGRRAVSRDEMPLGGAFLRRKTLFEAQVIYEN